MELFIDALCSQIRMRGMPKGSFVSRHPRSRVENPALIRTGGAAAWAQLGGFINAARAVMLEQLTMRVRFLNLRPMASSWEAEVPEFTEAALYEAVKQCLPSQALEFDLEHGVIYSRAEQVGSFRIVSNNSAAISGRKSARVVPFQRR